MVCVCFCRLSGESPFQGSSDAETLALVTAAQWEFDDESFEDISSQAKEFISSLLNKNIRSAPHNPAADPHTDICKASST